MESKTVKILGQDVPITVVDPERGLPEKNNIPGKVFYLCGLHITVWFTEKWEREHNDQIHVYIEIRVQMGTLVNQFRFHSIGEFENVQRIKMLDRHVLGLFFNQQSVEAILKEHRL